MRPLQPQPVCGMRRADRRGQPRVGALPPHRGVRRRGARLRDLPDLGAADWDIRFVRGPETARALGLAPERWLCDPAALIPKVHGGRGRGRLLRAGPQRIAFAPGPVLTQATAATLADKAGLHLLRHDLPPEAWIDQLLDCDAAI
jgi:hypothetical protein